MILFPAIDIYDGKAVRLLGGDYGKATVYGDPLDMARRFEDAGARWVHVVDLNGAEGSGDNFAVIEKIARTSLRVEAGGGLRSGQRVASVLSAGASRTVIGTLCASDPEAVGAMIERFGREAIVCGLDARDGKVTVKGWTEDSALTPLGLGRTLKALGAAYFLYTDVSRDGMLTGVNVYATAKLTEELGADVIASGGVKDLSDIEKLAGRGIYGVILGKAYYENKIDIREALKICAN